MAPNRFSTQPLYLQVRSRFVERIVTGAWKPGTLIPNEIDLARECGVSPGTIRKAVDLMVSDRLIIRRQGRGTFVNRQTADELATRFCKIRRADGAPIAGQSEIGGIAEAQPNNNECTQLELQSSERVYRFRRVQADNGRPIMIENVSVPATLFPDLATMTTMRHATFELALRRGLLFGRARERVWIGRATSPIARTLGIQPAAPIFVLDRVIRTLDERPVEWRTGYCNIADNWYVAEMH